MVSNRKFNGLLLLVVGCSCMAFTAGSVDLSQINVNDLQQQLPAELANTNLTLEDVKSVFREKCVSNLDKERGEEAFRDIEAATMALSDCATGLINITAMQAEIEEAKPKGELDVVFNSYCKKRPQGIECIEAFNSKLKPCLDKEEQENQEVFMRIIRSLFNFVCYKGGDQIALFIAEKGPECLESKRDELQQCLNTTFSGYLPEDGLESVKKLPKLVIGMKQCEDVEKLEKCIINSLEKCEEITPANIVESLFRFVKNETICARPTQSAKQTGDTKNATVAPIPSALAVIITLMTLTLKRLM